MQNKIIPLTSTHWDIILPIDEKINKLMRGKCKIDY